MPRFGMNTAQPHCPPLDLVTGMNRTWNYLCIFFNIALSESYRAQLYDKTRSAMMVSSWERGAQTDLMTLCRVDDVTNGASCRLTCYHRLLQPIWPATTMTLTLVPSQLCAELSAADPTYSSDPGVQDAVASARAWEATAELLGTDAFAKLGEHFAELTEARRVVHDRPGVAAAEVEKRVRQLYSLDDDGECRVPSFEFRAGDCRRRAKVITGFTERRRRRAVRRCHPYHCRC